MEGDRREGEVGSGHSLVETSEVAEEEQAERGLGAIANSEELEGSLLPFIVLRPTTLVMLRLWASLLP